MIITPPSPRQHAPGGLLSHVKDPIQVDVEHLLPFLGRNIYEGMPEADTGIIDEHVNAPGQVIQFVKSSGYRLRVGNIGQ